MNPLLVPLHGHWTSCRLGIGPPQPAQGIGEDRATVLAVMATAPADERVIVAAVPQRGNHLKICQPPVPVLVVQVGLAILEKTRTGRLGSLRMRDG